jgi:ABC-type bacteriocin/lantibiotic exporter with double-glycine peptidase domain
MKIEHFRNIIASLKMIKSEDKNGVAFLILLSVVNSLIQTLGIISIMPFIAIISNPDLVESSSQIVLLKDLLGIESYHSLLIVFGDFTFFAITFSNIFYTIPYWINLRFFSYKEHHLTKELLNIFLSKQASAFYRTKNSQILKYILSDIDRVLVGTQVAVLDLISDLLTCLVIFILLLYIDIWVTVITTITLGISYTLIYVLLAKYISRYGKSFSLLESKIYASINHAIELFREIRVSGRQAYFVEKFSTPSELLAKQSVKYYLLSFLPVQLVEILAFGILIVVATYYSLSDESSLNAIATITIFAFATYRLVPLLKSIFSGVEDIMYNRTPLQELMSQYSNDETDTTQTIKSGVSKERLTFDNSISLNNISYRYAPNLPLILNDFNLEITKGRFTCISGKSGSGKSTILDIILGLISPSSGSLSLDRTPIKSANIRPWQNNIGYVPQNIQFVNGTVNQNIAFGVAESQIDSARVKVVAKLAKIDDMIENRLPDKYQSQLGDGGILLSGGEKQRIGIARSLYHDPQVLIFDESTNELDLETESEILASIKTLNDKTVVFVSHKPAVIELAYYHLEIS